MSKRHGRGLFCRKCRKGPYPVNRENLRRQSRHGGYLCKSCERTENYEARKGKEFKIK